MRSAPISPLLCQWIGDDLFVDALSVPEQVWLDHGWDEGAIARWVAAEMSYGNPEVSIRPRQVILFYPAYTMWGDYE